MAILRGFVGGLLRAAAAVYLITGGLLLARFEELVEEFRAAVESAADANAIASALEQYALQAISMIEELWRPLLIVLVLWIVGGSLLSRAWGALDKDWPRLARYSFKLLGFVFMLLALLGLIVPARLFIASLMGSLGGLLEFLGMPWLQELAPLLIILPMSLPVFKAVFALKYSEGRGRLGSLLLMAGGLLYLVAAYQVYTTYRLGNVIMNHVLTLFYQGSFSQGQLAEPLLREASLTLADLGQLFINRVEALLLAIAGASLLYALGFALHKPRGRGGSTGAKAKRGEPPRDEGRQESLGGAVDERVHILQDSERGATLVQGLRGR